jgi:hypothetical protein
MLAALWATILSARPDSPKLAMVTNAPAIEIWQSGHTVLQTGSEQPGITPKLQNDPKQPTSPLSEPCLLDRGCVDRG